MNRTQNAIISLDRSMPLGVLYEFLGDNEGAASEFHVAGTLGRADAAWKLGAILLVLLSLLLSEHSRADDEGRTREIVGYGAKITVVPRPNGEVVLVDRNDRCRYFSDAASPKLRLLANENGDLSYKNERGDTVTIHANNDRTVSIPKLGLTLRESIQPGGTSFVREFTIGDDSKLREILAGGRWVRDSPESRTWQRNNEVRSRADGDAEKFEGALEFTDFYLGEVRLTSDATHQRQTLRRDGYAKLEDLDEKNEGVVNSITVYPDGRRIRRSRLAHAQNEGQPDEIVEAVVVRAANARMMRWVEVQKPDQTFIVELETFYGDIYSLNEDTQEWSLVEHGSEKAESFYGTIETVGLDSVRITAGSGGEVHQIETYRGAGSRTQVLMTERMRPTNAFESVLEPHDEPLYTVDEAPNGRTTLLDHQTGRQYVSNATDDQDALTLSGSEVRFKDEFGREVWLNRSGFHVVKSGKIAWAFRADRRIVADYRVEGESLKKNNLWSYRRTPDGRTALKLAKDLTEGTLFGFTIEDPKSGKQIWALTKGDKKKIELHDDLDMRRGNGRIIVNGNQKIGDMLNGTVVTEKLFSVDESGERKPLNFMRPDPEQSNLPTVTEITVSTQENPSAAFSLITHRDAEGHRVKQEWSSATDRWVRGGSREEFESFQWRIYDAAGQPKPGGFAGEAFIDKYGGVIKVIYETEEHASGSRVKFRTDGQGRLFRDAAGQPVPLVKEIGTIFTNGHSEQAWPDGRTVCRDGTGDVLSVHNEPAGLDVALYYLQPEDGKKRLTAFRDRERQFRFVAVKDHAFVPEKNPDGVRTPAHLFVNVQVDRQKAELTWRGPSEASLLNTVITNPDGSFLYSDGDALSAGMNPGGRLVSFTDRHGRETTIERDSDDQILRIESQVSVTGLGAKGFTVMDSQFAKSLPDSNDTALLGTHLAAGLDDGILCVCFVNSDQHFVRIWGDGTYEEYENVAGGRLLRVGLADGFRVVVEGARTAAEKLLKSHIDAAKSISQVGYEDNRRFVKYVNPAGEEIHRYPLGAMRRFDSSGRLTEVNVNHDNWRLKYDGDGPANLSEVRGKYFSARIDGAPRKITWQSLDATGKVLSSRAAKRLELDEHSNVVVQFPADDGSSIRFEILESASARRLQILANGIVNYFDDLDRIVTRRNSRGWHLECVYEKDDAVPDRVIALSEVWQRSRQAANNGDGTFVWTDQKTPDRTFTGTLEACLNYLLSDNVNNTANDKESVRNNPVELVRNRSGRLLSAKLADGKLAIECGYEGDQLTQVVHSTVDRNGKKTVDAVVREADGSWRDGTGRSYDSLWVDDATGDAVMLAERGKQIRSLSLSKEHHERRILLGTNYCTGGLSPQWIGANWANEISRVSDSMGHVTFFDRGNDGEIDLVGQGPFRAIRTNDGTFVDVRNPDLRIAASLSVLKNGERLWICDTGCQRVEYQDGSVELRRTDGSTTIAGPAESFRRHIFAPGNPVREVTWFPVGRIDVTMDDGTLMRQLRGSNQVFVFANGESLENSAAASVFGGIIRVARNGNLTIQKSSSGETTVYLANGRMERFLTDKGDGWRELSTGEQFPDLPAWTARLVSLQSLPPHEPDDRLELRSNSIQDFSMNIEWESLFRTIPPATVDAEGNRTWDFMPYKDQWHPADRQIDAVVLKKDGLVEVTRVDGKVTTYDAGQAHVDDEGRVSTLSPVPGKTGVVSMWRALEWCADGDWKAPHGRKQIEAAVGDKALTGRRYSGLLYWYGYAVPQDRKQAIKFYSAAAQIENDAEALALLRRAAAAAHSDANYQLGSMFARGQGVPQSAETAFQFYLLAADRGHVWAQTEVAKMYLAGSGVDRDAIRGQQYLEKAAGQGDKEAKKVLLDLASGKQPETPAQVRIPPQLLQAAQDERPEAMMQVGLLYIQAKQIKEGRSWLEKAVSKGFLPAKLLLDKVNRELNDD